MAPIDPADVPDGHTVVAVGEPKPDRAGLRGTVDGALRWARGLPRLAGTLDEDGEADRVLDAAEGGAHELGDGEIVRSRADGLAPWRSRREASS